MKLAFCSQSMIAAVRHDNGTASNIDHECAICGDLSLYGPKMASNDFTIQRRCIVRLLYNRSRHYSRSDRLWDITSYESNDADRPEDVSLYIRRCIYNAYPQRRMQAVGNTQRYVPSLC